LTALAFLFANSDATGDEVAVNWIKQEMRKAGYTEVGTRLALSRLGNLGYVTSGWRDNGDERWAVYGVTQEGEAWLLENQSRLQVQVHSRRVPDDLVTATEITDDDIPF
jgi:hypothetical protein